MLIFHALSSNLVANVLNVVVLTAALSVYNSGVYSNSRMLFGLAKQGNAPKVLCSVNKRGIPLAALGASALATGVCVLVNYFMPGKAFEVLMGLVVSALIINWAMITLIHLKFRQAKRAAGEETSFRSLGYPFTNYLCLAFMAGILVDVPDAGSPPVGVPDPGMARGARGRVSLPSEECRLCTTAHPHADPGHDRPFFQTRPTQAMFEHIDAYPGDPILTLNENFQKDPRDQKVNPEHRHLLRRRRPDSGDGRSARSRNRAAARQQREAVPADGRTAYRDAVQALVFGADHPARAAGRIATLQTLGGSGAEGGRRFPEALLPGIAGVAQRSELENHRFIFERRLSR